MAKRKTVKPSEIEEGYYVAFGSDLGVVGFFKVQYHIGEGYVIWGLSRWRGRIKYRTRGMSLEQWLSRQPKGVQFRRDKDRTDWPMENK